MAIVFWLILVPLGAMVVAAWVYRIPDHGVVPASVKRLYRRSLGDYRRFVRGRAWMPGESQVYRTTVRGVSVYAVDRHTWVQKRATCMVTIRQVVVRDAEGGSVEMPLMAIRCVRRYRQYEPGIGSSYGVILERTGSAVHLPEGDVRLLCASHQQSLDLESAIQWVTGNPVAT
jgi:hypothetical protein